MRITREWRGAPARCAFAAFVALSLGAGAESVTAGPVSVGREAVCYSGECHRECRENGWETGSCVNGYCECR